MHATQAFAFLALAGTSLAAPQWGNWGGFFRGSNNAAASPAADNVEVVTAYTTVTMGDWRGYQPTEAPVASPTYVAQKPKETTVAQAPPSAAAPSTDSGSDTGYMAIVNEYRGKLGLSSLSQSSKLESNAAKTARDGNGEMKHQLNSGTMAQVLAPGKPSEFEHVFVGGWLCEIPDMPGLNGICNEMSKGWSYGGQTGHADILKSGTYKNIGCACETGIWSCDLS